MLPLIPGLEVAEPGRERRRPQVVRRSVGPVHRLEQQRLEYSEETAGELVSEPYGGDKRS